MASLSQRCVSLWITTPLSTFSIQYPNHNQITYLHTAVDFFVQGVSAPAVLVCGLQHPSVHSVSQPQSHSSSPSTILFPQIESILAEIKIYRVKSCSFGHQVKSYSNLVCFTSYFLDWKNKLLTPLFHTGHESPESP